MTAFVLGLSGCHTSHKDGPTGTFGVAPAFVIFKDELQSGGGAFEFPGDQNQSLSFNDTSNPISQRSIRYSWNGGDVNNPGCTPNPTHLFAGFDLMHTPLRPNYTSTLGRDLRGPGYTKVTFFARGSLSSRTIIKVEVAGNGTAAVCGHVFSPCISLYSPTAPADQRDDPDHPCGRTAELTPDWGNAITIPISSAEQASIKDFFKATFIFTDLVVTNPLPGQGGTVFFDKIQYEPPGP